MTKIAVINYGPKSDYAAMLPEVAGALHVYSHHELAGTEGFAHYEYVPDCEFVPYPELMIRRSAGDAPFTHVITDNEYDLERAARIRRDLGIPGQSPESALSFRDKEVMKRTAGRTVPVARYARLENVTDLTGFVAETGYPVVVKPVKQGGSRDIVTLYGDDELVEFTRRHWRDDLMVEQFVEGPMYHVDAVIAPGYRFVASSRYLRSCLGVLSGENNGSLQLHPEEKFAARLEEFLDQVLDAFETPGTSAYHLEVFHTPDDRLVLCEIASRVGGNRIPHLTRATYGVDLHRTWLRQSVGLPVPPAPVEAPEFVRGSVSVVPQGRPVGAPPRPPFEWIDHYEVNAALAPGAKPANSTSHLCFAIVRGADLAEVEQRVLETEAWLMANLVEPVTETGEGAEAPGVTTP